MHLSNVDVFENKILLCWAVVCFFLIIYYLYSKCVMSIQNFVLSQNTAVFTQEV